LLILTDQQTGITTAIVVAFSVLLLLEGVLALKFTKPDLKNGLRKIQESELTTTEKARREEALKKANTVSSVFNIAIAVAVIVVWFFIL
jgi:hypothetical protein